MSTTILAHGQYPRLFHGNSRIREVSGITMDGVAPVFCLKLSPDGCFLATGDEDGILEVRYMQSNTWRRVCLYSTGASVRTIIWHPVQPRTLFCGSANGALHKITVVLNGENVHCDALLPGYIHLLQLSPDGRRLVIAHGQMISLVENPFPQQHSLGQLIDLQIPIPNSSAPDRSIIGHSIPRAIFFLPCDDSIILLAFLGRHDLLGHSLRDQHSAWSIPLREDAIIGSAAISPSGERIAVMNLQNGIDFYSTSRRQYLSTTRYNLSNQYPPQNFIVDILFVDEDTVAFGHSDGHVGFATFGVAAVDTFFEISRGQENSEPVQAVTFGLVHDKPLVFGLTSPPHTTSIRYPSTIHIGRIDTPGMPLLLAGRTTRAHARHSISFDKISTLTFLGIIWVTLLSILWGQTIAPPKDCPPASTTRIAHAAKTPPDRLSPSTASAFDPLSSCICTVTGSVDAAKETGTN